MKKSTVRMLIALIVLIPLFLVSFLMFDLKNVISLADNRNHDYESGGLNNKILLSDTVSFKDVKIATINADIKLNKSDSSSYEISSDDEQYVKQNFKVKVKNDTLYIEEKKKNKFLDFGFDYPDVDIKVNLKDGANAGIDLVNGDLSSSSDLKKLNLDLVNGEVDLSGTDAYDININGVNADISLGFANYNSKFTLNAVSGDLKYFGDDIDSIIPLAFKRTKGNGEKEINMQLVNGDITIEEN